MTFFSISHRMMRPLWAVVFAAVLSSCSTLEDMASSVSDVLSFDSSSPAIGDAQQMPNAAQPTYNLHDSFTYDVDGTQTIETVLDVKKRNISWKNDSNATWETSINPILLPLAEHQTTRSYSRNAQKLFPLEVDKSVRFSVTTNPPGGDKVKSVEKCNVTGTPSISIRAGNFNTFEILCWRQGYFETLYYAPKVGHIVLYIRDGIFDKVTKELVSYKKAEPQPKKAVVKPSGTVAAVQKVATQSPKQAGKSNGGGQLSNQEMLSGLSTTVGYLAERMDHLIEIFERGETGKVAPPASAANGLYGVQIGAYGSKARAQQAWEYTFSIEAADLLSGMKLHYQDYQPPDGRPKLVRIIVGEFTSKKEAASECAKFKQRSLDCWVVGLI
jgi:hypothetical protein